VAATIRDVAERAGVSFKTVSRVMNDEPSVRPATRERVRMAIRELGYTPHHTARQMRTRRSKTIGFVSDEIATSPFAVDIVKGAQLAAWEHGMLLLVVNTERDPEMEHAAIASLLERRVEGIVSAAMFHRVVEPLPRLREVPTVLVDCFDAAQVFPAVVPDEEQGGYLATRTLIDRGHRRIGFVNLNPIASAAAATGRLAGYRRALAEAGIGYDDDLVRHTSMEPNQGYGLTCELLDLPARPTALFCGNDRAAAGAYCAIYQRGLRIPDDVAVVGFDDQEEIAAHLMPQLTTVALPHLAMGRWGVERLIELLAAPSRSDAPYAVHRLACPLVARASH
jgi:LacI family transcriptional regulator